MNKIFNLFFIGALLLIVCVTMTMEQVASLNLAILYNDDVEDLFSSEESFTKINFDNLLQAKQVPILVPGDIALYLALEITEPFVPVAVQNEFEEYAQRRTNGWEIGSTTADFHAVELTRDWCLYVSATPQHFVLFVPVAYAQTRGAYDERLKTVDLAKLGFDTTMFNAISAEELASCSMGFAFDSDKVATAITSIFAEPVAGQSWNIFIAGHGLSTEYACGMLTTEFFKLIDLFSNKISTKCLVYGTCYGGGALAAAIEKQLLEVVRRPVIISLSGAGTIVYANPRADYGTFFKKLDELFSTAVYDTKTLADSCACIKWDDGFQPLVLLPTQKKFIEMGALDLVIFNDESGNSHVRGTKATTEFCNETTHEIKFGSKIGAMHDTCILLATDRVKKKLTFEAKGLRVSFAAKAMDYHQVTFDEININSGFDSLLRAFGDKGIQRFTIKKCVISHEEDDFYINLLNKLFPGEWSQLTLHNVDVIISDDGRAPVVLFEHDGKLYAYNAVEFWVQAFYCQKPQKKKNYCVLRLSNNLWWVTHLKNFLNHLLPNK